MRRAITLALLLSTASWSVGHAAWGKSRVWDDGRAEVAAYESERVVDGKVRAFREHLITWRENSVFKFNQVIPLNLENYPLDVLVTVIASADTLQRVMKLTASLQDWQGAIAKSYKGNLDGSGGVLTWTASSGVESSQPLELALEKDDYFEDQLPLSFRALPFKDGFEKKIRLFDSFMVNGGTSPAVSQALVTVAAPEPVRCKAGSIPAWVVTVKKANGSDKYWFEKAEPNLLVKMETQDGRRRLLLGRARWSYWDRRLPRPKVLF